MFVPKKLTQKTIKNIFYKNYVGLSEFATNIVFDAKLNSLPDDRARQLIQPDEVSEADGTQVKSDEGVGSEESVVLSAETKSVF